MYTPHISEHADNNMKVALIPATAPVNGLNLYFTDSPYNELHFNS